MTTAKTLVSSGLVFLRMKDIDIVEAGNRVTATFDALGQRVGRVRILSEARAQINTPYHNVRLCLVEDHEIAALGDTAGLVLSLQILHRTDTPVKAEISGDAIKAHLLRALNKTAHADFVLWSENAMLLAGREFMQATAPLDNPGRGQRNTLKLPKPGMNRAHPSAQPALHPALALQHIDASSEQLDRQLQHAIAWANAPADQGTVRDALLSTSASDQEPDPALMGSDTSEPTARLRLSTWFISMAVALLYLPVGVMLILINLLRGENLRLANQAAALSGTFMALQAFGSVAQAATVLHTMLP